MSKAPAVFTPHEREVFTATLVAMSEHGVYKGEMPFDDKNDGRLNVAFLMWKEGCQQVLELFNELCDVSDDIDFIKRVMNKAGTAKERLPEAAL